MAITFWKRPSKLLSWMMNNRQEQAVAVVPPTVQPQTRTVVVHASRDWKTSEISDLTADWGTTPKTTYSLLQTNMRVLKARSREESRSNDYARRFIHLLRQNIVGPRGFSLQAKTTNSQGDADMPARRALEADWKRWKRPENCHLSGRWSFNELCRLIIETVAKDGECIIRRVRGGPMGIRLDVIDSELLDANYHEDLPNGNVIRFGVEMDRNGRPVRYHFAPPHDHFYAQGHVQRTPVAARDIFHLFIPEAPDQVRGIPWLATPASRLHMVRGFEQAAVIAARDGASNMGFIKGWYGDDETPPDEQPIREVEPGVLQRVPDSFELEQYNSDYPRGEFDGFMNRMLKGASAGFNVPYYMMSNDLADVNFATAKIGQHDAHDWFEAVQGWMVEHFLEPFWPMYLQDRFTGGGIPIGSGFLDFSRFDKYLAVEIQGRSWESVERLKEAQADNLELANGLTTHRRIWIDRNLDPDDMLAELIEERALFKQHGIAPHAKAPSQAPPGQSPQGDGDDPNGSGDDEGPSDGEPGSGTDADA